MLEQLDVRPHSIIRLQDSSPACRGGQEQTGTLIPKVRKWIILSLFRSLLLFDLLNEVLQPNYRRIIW